MWDFNRIKEALMIMWVITPEAKKKLWINYFEIGMVQLHLSHLAWKKQRFIAIVSITKSDNKHCENSMEI
jgi:hypothetical protein